ncbi:MAG: hypothetical protein Q8M96_20055 [Rubrivivax sp.]|nr:hypothetical protein [Rubrivivax sp.]
MHSFLGRVFSLPAKFETDPELRASVQKLVDAELPRMQGLLASWLDQERQQAPAANVNRLSWRLRARVANEMAQWRLDLAGPRHEELLQQALMHPRACDWPKHTDSLLAVLVHQWRGVPAVNRAELLAAEATSLQRWGLPRGEMPRRPVPSADDIAAGAIDNLLQRQLQPAVPMPPVLAWRLLGDRDPVAERKGRQTRCVLQQWATALSLGQPGDARAETAALALRYGHSPMADLWWGDSHPGVSASDGYPDLARSLEVEGTVQVAYSLDAKGQLQQALVERRDIRVPGTPGRRAVALETLLDAASLARVADMTHAKPRPEEVQQGRATRRIEFVWQLK